MEPGFSRFGKYEIQAELGRGGFGRVFRAFDPTVGRLVAIKILLAEAGADLLTRFRNEAMAAGSLRHENIVTIYEFGEESGAPYIAMEYLEGEDLQQAIASARPLSLLEKISIMAQVADGLDCAHRNGVVHRDVKPANIRLLPDLTVKIMDFGIARLIRDAAETRLTRQGHVIGTLLYMAPEQVMGADIDMLCDIFAYGVTFYELLTGRHPFSAADPRSVFYKITSEDPEMLRHVVPDCPEALENVIRKALHKDRELRYQSLFDLRMDMEPILIELRKERAATLVSEAQRLVDEGDYERSRTLVNEATDLDPGSPSARQLRDVVQRELRRRALRPRIQTLMAKADQLAADGKYAEALQTIEAAVRLDPDDPALQARITDVQQQQQRSRESNRLLVEARTDLAQASLAAALQKASEALALNANSADARALLETVQLEINKREQQRRVNEKLRKVRELLLLNSFDEALAMVNGLEQQQRETPEARDLLARIAAQKAERDRQERLRAELNAARGLLDAVQFADAVQLLRRLQNEFPGEPRVDGLLAYAQQELASVERAHAIEKLRGDVLARAEAQDFEEAVDVLSRGLAQYPGETSILRLRDTVLLARMVWERQEAVEQTVRQCEGFADQNQFDDAFAALEQTLEKYPDDVTLGSLRRRLEADRERYHRTRAILHTLADADAHMKEAQPERAVARLEAALAQYPDERLRAALTDAREELAAKERAAKLDRLVGEVRHHIDRRQFDRAFHDLDDAGPEFPGEPSLARLRESVAAAKVAWEREQAIEAAGKNAESLRSEQRFDEALEVVQSCLRKFPDTDSLIRLESVLREERERYLRAQAVGAAVEEAQELAGRGEHAAAVERLRMALGAFPGEAALASALAHAEEEFRTWRRAQDVSRAAGEARELASGNDFQRALEVIDAVAASWSGLQELDDLRADIITEQGAFIRRQEIAAAREQTFALCAEERYADAVRVAEDALGRFPGEQPLLEAQQHAEAGWERLKRRESIKRAVAAAEERLQRGEPRAAVELLEAAQVRYGRDEELRKVLVRAEEELRVKLRAEAIEQARQQARSLAERKRFDRALATLEAVERAHGADPAIAEAREALQREIAAEQENERRAGAIRAAIAHALTLLRRNLPDDAVAALEQAQNENGPSPEIETALTQAREAATARRRKEAVANATEAAAAHVQSKNFDAAIGTVEAALAEWPDDPRLTALKKRMLEARSTWMAEQEIAAAVQECERQCESEKYQEALDAAAEALRRYPDAAELKRVHRIATAGLEQQKRAIAIAESVAESAARIEAGDPEKATKLLLSAIERLGRSTELDAALSRANAALKDKQRAEAIVRAVKRAGAHAATERFADALSVLDGVERQHGADPSIATSRESVQEAQARWETERQIASAIETASQHRAAGRFEEALQLLDAALGKYGGDDRLASARQQTVAEFDRRRRVDAIHAAASQAAQSMAGGDPSAAVATLQQAIDELGARDELGPELDRSRAAERELKARREREAAVRRIVEHCETLIGAGSLADAGRTLQEGLRDYPAEPELVAMQDRLRAEWERQRRLEATRRAAKNARSLLEQGQPRRAVQLLEAAAAQYPDDALVQNALALAREAEAEQRRAEAVESVCRETRLYLDRNDFDRALKTVEMNLETWGGEPRLNELRETVMSARRDFEAGRTRKLPVATAQAVTDEVPVPVPAPTRKGEIVPPAWADPKPAVIREPEPAGAQPPVYEPPTVQPSPSVDKWNFSKLLQKPVLAGVAGAIAVALAFLGVRALRTAPDAVLIIETVPAGASVSVGNRHCTTPGCEVALPPGTHRVDARLPGYAPVSQNASLRKGEGTRARIVLEPLPTSLAVTSNFKSGEVQLDGKRVGNLREGAFNLDSVPEGQHSVRITGPEGEFSANLKTAAGQVPSVHSDLKMTEIDAILVTSLGQSVRVSCPACATPALIDGKPSNGAVPAGNHELTASTTTGQAHTMTFRTGDAPAIAIHLNSTANPTGTLVVETNVDGASVQIDRRSLARQTEGGRLVVPLEQRNYTVTVQKPGYRVTPARVIASIRKGDQFRAAFRLEPNPATVVISGVPDGTSVTIDGKSVGTVTSGSLTTTIAPGVHTVAVARDGYKPASVQRPFGPGDTVRLDESILALEPLPRRPAPAPVTVQAPPAPEQPTSEELEAREWAAIRLGRNPAAIEAFLQGRPDSPHRGEAQQLLAQLEWDALDRKDRAALERFVARHKGSTLAAQAQAELTRMDREASAAIRQKREEDRLAKERAEIANTLAIFATAFARKDLKLLRSVWPKPTDEDALAQAFRSSRGIRQELRPIGPIDIAGDRATVRCMRVIEQVGQFGPQPAREEPKTVRLHKENTRWVIDEIE